MLMSICRRTVAALLTTVALAGVTVPTAQAAGEDDPSDLVLHGPDASTRSAVVLRESAPTAGLPTPVAAHDLPAAFDLAPTYQAGVSCDPVDRPGATELGRLLVNTYGTGVYGISRYCDGSVSEHHEGRAVDWMLDSTDPAQAAVANSFLAWLTADGGAMARRTGVQYAIWNRRMWRAYAPERGWAAYSGISPHTDHIHLSLTWDGAMGRTSWWTGRPVTTRDVGTCRVYVGQPAPLYAGPRSAPCATPLPAPRSAFPVVAIGSRDRASVTRGQLALGVTADGVFGRGTQRAVLDYQRAAGLPTSGALDAATWNRLAPAPTPVTPPGPTPAPTSTTTPTSSPTSSPTPTQPPAPESTPSPTPAPTDTTTPQSPVVTTKVVPLPASVTHPLAPHASAVLRPGSSGSAVRALQQALGLRVSGRMDTATVSAVKQVQRRWGLRATGVVDARTWRRVELTRYPWLGYTGATLRPGAQGAAVTALQKALGVGADGRFGPRTTAAVQAVQARYGLPATGTVDAPTWRAVTHAAR